MIQSLISIVPIDGIRRLFPRIRQGQASSRQADRLDCPGRFGCRNRPLEPLAGMVFRCLWPMEGLLNCTS